MKIVPLLLILGFTACKPQTESREHMDLISNRMSDSILKLLDSGFAQPSKILAGRESPIASSTSSSTPATTLK